MQLALRRVLFAFVVFACPIAAYADPITLVTVQRYVQTTASVGSSGAGDINSNNDMATAITLVGNGANSSAASAELNSTVSPSTRTFSGSGSASVTQLATSVGSGAQAFTHYFVAFTLAQAQEFNFDAMFTGIGDLGDRLSGWETLLWREDKTILDFSGRGNQSLAESGILGPGTYGFEVSTGAETFAQQRAHATTTDQFALTFSDPPGAQTPEPASLLLLGTGLAAAAGARKRTLRGR